MSAPHKQGYVNVDYYEDPDLALENPTYGNIYPTVGYWYFGEIKSLPSQEFVELEGDEKEPEYVFKLTLPWRCVRFIFVLGCEDYNSFLSNVTVTMSNDQVNWFPVTVNGGSSNLWTPSDYVQITTESEPWEMDCSNSLVWYFKFACSDDVRFITPRFRNATYGGNRMSLYSTVMKASNNVAAKGVLSLEYNDVDSEVE